jgi:hypothetical protein
MPNRAIIISKDQRTLNVPRRGVAEMSSKTKKAKNNQNMAGFPNQF